MAVMIPTLRPKETDSRGEESIFSTLREGLPDEFIVIHSLPWLCAAVKQIDAVAAPTGEIDFLILHPKLGALVLEVKSGAYRVDGLLFVHLNTGRSIDPVRQTRHNVHGLARWLGDDPGLRLRMGYGFVFPDSYFGDAVVSAAMVDVAVNPPQRILVDKGQMPNIADRVKDIMRYWQTALRNPALGEDKVRRIVEALCPQYDGTPTWATRVVYDEQIWLRLTREQSKVVEAACRHHRMLVTGWPGTGKTVIAVEVARRIAATEGKRVLVVTFNSRLAEYIRRQFDAQDGSCVVVTWHGLCSSARKKLALPANQTEEWFKEQCLADLQSAVGKGWMENYDVLVLDEAQALRPEWCEALISWFDDKKILAFCDETQVFAFESQTTKLEQLRDHLGGVQPFFLTIVLRMPTVVTDRLAAVKPPSYQLISPRNSEPDALQELLAPDWLVALDDTVQSLKAQGLQGDEILVLTRVWASVALYEAVVRLGVQLETVARYRGLESPAVIVMSASSMDDAELFCAYSRATTVCIAIYSPEELGWKVTGDFHKTLLAVGENDAQALKARNESRTRNLMAGEMVSRITSVESICLAWSPTWNAWLVDLDHPNDPAETWIDYLVSHHPWPVFAWYGSSRRDILHAQPVAGMQCDFHCRGLKLQKCDACGELLPHQSFVEVQCLACAKQMKGTMVGPEPWLFEQLTAYDKLIRSGDAREAKTKAGIRGLPLPLAATRARMFAFEKRKRSKVIDEGLPSGGLMYRSALAFVQSWIAYRSDGEHLVLQELALTSYERYEALRSVELASWQKHLASALSTCYGKKLLTKIGKGRYAPVND